MKKLIIANWKMQFSYKESIALAKKFAIRFPKGNKHELVLCPGFSSLEEVGKIIKSSGLKLGAQSVFWHSSGAFTGEVSPLSLKELSCSYVIIGHSERRKYLKETDEMVNQKIIGIMQFKSIIPILCIGESAKQRKNWKVILKNQLKKDLVGVDKKKAGKIVVAYEPIWAIGTGKTVKAEEAMQAYDFIKDNLLKLGWKKSQFRVMYGGSVDSKNAKSLNNFDGFLVGTSSLKLSEFYKITKAI